MLQQTKCHIPFLVFSSELFSSRFMHRTFFLPSFLQLFLYSPPHPYGGRHWPERVVISAKYAGVVFARFGNLTSSMCQAFTCILKTRRLRQSFRLSFFQPNSSSMYILQSWCNLWYIIFLRKVWLIFKILVYNSVVHGWESNSCFSLSKALLNGFGFFFLWTADKHTLMLIKKLPFTGMCILCVCLCVVLGAL